MTIELGPCIWSFRLLLQKMKNEKLWIKWTISLGTKLTKKSLWISWLKCFWH